MSELEIVTFGCRLNAYESEGIRARATEAGLDNAIIVNTCAVTAEAVRQSRQEIRRLRREKPKAQIIVTGCAAQIEPETYAAMPEVDRVLGNTEKLSATSYASDFLANAPRVIVNDIMAVRETAAQFVDSFEGKARAVLQVQNGCDHRCTFCIIPYGRGNSRSVGVGAVVDEARRLVQAGFNEIVLSGVDLTAYGADLPGKPTLGTLIARILKHVPELKRLRLSSIDSIEMDRGFFELLAGEERLMPHFHLSVQSGDNLTLKRMKRRHSREDTLQFCETVRRLRPEAAFGADLIAGFPTENDAMFASTLALVEDAGLSYLHVFPFSARKNTPAARMPQLPRNIVKERAKTLREAGDAALQRRLQSLTGSTQDILVEKPSVGRLPGLGRTPCFANVHFSGAGQAGDVVRARIEGAEARNLVGQIMSDVALERVPATA
ncbi:MAG: tRNA (N(6)-L-threonylcarbamoyladenosine(37)-C(2))-methylthiotransferase MtaB [Alphaproteobacteria bacterium]|nr:tRNA (N(6)-L-threonylcarbamoyladenosine(37)-C(2))-methylthiotransferase MtaB [Alphaproteobacteria bacterium]